MRRVWRFVCFAVDLAVTLTLWFYFLFGYSLFYLPFIVILYPFVPQRDVLIQKINHFFYRGFFLLLRLIAPRVNIRIDDSVRNIQSSIIVSNHRSYLDPLLYISLFPMHKTIVKGIFFKVPVMGWIMRKSGFMPHSDGVAADERMTDGVNSLPQFIAGGGNLFIFPEGRRSRNGRIGRFHKGAFSLSARYGIPVELLYIHNTDRVFPPGRFVFTTCERVTIILERLGRIESKGLKAREIRDRAFSIYMAHEAEVR